jgi:hypothetical protein
MFLECSLQVSFSMLDPMEVVEAEQLKARVEATR